MRAVYLATAAMAALLATPAQAQDRNPCGAGLVCASDPDTVMRAMAKAALEPRKAVDAQGDPMIESDAAPYHFDVFFYGCETGKNCDSLRFEVSFAKSEENTLALVNKWNAGHRFLHAWIADDGRLVAAHDVATIGGVNDRNFADVLDWWKSKLGELADFFAEELKDEEPVG